jgi:hypothetical protein
MKNEIRKELLDELLEGYTGPEDLTGPEGLLKRLTGALVGRALDAEMTEHLGYERNAPEGNGSGNSRNGTSAKTLTTEQGPVPIHVPRDRNGTFEPRLVKKHQRRFTGFDEGGCVLAIEQRRDAPVSVAAATSHEITDAVHDGCVLLRKLCFTENRLRRPGRGI